MAKNILVITGSARKEGNSIALANAFIKGARESGHAVRRFDAATKLIYPCRDCDSCWSKGRPCIVEDRFNELAPYLEVSDMIVFAAPVYWYSWPASVKLVIDKLYAYTVSWRKRDLRLTESLLLSTAEETDMDKAFGALLMSYQQTADFFKWKVHPSITVPGLKEATAIVGHEALDRAYQYGKSLE